MAIAAAILLAVYFFALLIVLLKPPKQRDPQYGMAVGCCIMVELGIAAVGGVLALAVAFQIHWLVKGIFYATAFPAVIGVPQLARLGWRELKRRYLAKQTWVRPEWIAKTVSGKTHVIGQPVGAEFRPYREHRYFAPDGKLILYREELAAITRAPGADGTWGVDGHYLVVTIPAESPEPKRYVLFRDRAGLIGYFNHAPGTATDRQLAFRTVEVNTGEPVVTPVTSDSTPQESA
jgi:hypothetical protein